PRVSTEDRQEQQAGHASIPCPSCPSYGGLGSRGSPVWRQTTSRASSWIPRCMSTRAWDQGSWDRVYGTVLAHRLMECGLHVERQKPVSFVFDGHRFEEGFRTDLLVERRVVVELNSVEAMAPVHAKQSLTYLRLL